jgi:hypothetical protein
MKQLLMLLEIFVRGEAELNDRAIRERAAVGPVMAFDVLLAGLGVFEALVEVKTSWTRTLEVLFAVEKGEVFRVTG